MRQDEYLRELERQLAKLPEAARRDVLADYAEHFAAGRADGKDDAAIAASLGSPRHVAAACYADLMVTRAEAAEHVGPKLRSLARAVLSAAGLGFFNMVFVFGPFIGVVGVLCGIWAAALAPLFAGGAVLQEAGAMLGAALVTTLWGWGHVLIALGLFVLSGFFVLLMSLLTKLFVDLTVRYVRLNFEIVTR